MSKYVCPALVAISMLLFASPSLAQTAPLSEVLSGHGRFLVLQQFNGEAVLDQETGLVWQQTPSHPESLYPVAIHSCMNATVGERKGWRLPSMSELTSLLDTSQSYPALGAGHPFTDVDLERPYWTTTATWDNPNVIWVLSVATGQLSRVEVCIGAGCGVLKNPPAVWCVRDGGRGAQ